MSSATKLYIGVGLSFLAMAITIGQPFFLVLMALAFSIARVEEGLEYEF